MSAVLERWEQLLASIEELREHEQIDWRERREMEQRFLADLAPAERAEVEDHKRHKREAEEVRRQEAQRAFLASFSCPDLSGEKAPCRQNENRSGFVIPYHRSRRWLDCPVAAQVECAPLKKLRREQWEAAGRRMGIPEDLLPVSFDSVEPTDIVRRVKRYVEGEADRGLCLVLMGSVGVGKTLAACAGLRARGDGHFVFVPALGRALLDPDARDAEWAKVIGKRLLVLDDLGVEYRKHGGFLDTQLDELFWHREAHRLPTIVTTNLLRDELRERLSERIVDRLRGEWGRAYIAKGPSLRRKRSPE